MDELQNEAAGLVKKIREHTIKSILDVEVGGDRVLRDCALSQIKRETGDYDATIGEIIAFVRDEAFSNHIPKVVDLRKLKGGAGRR